jgi:hypothetical protein
MSERTSRKRVPIPQKPTADQWVAQGQDPEPQPAAPIKRLTLDLPAPLHRAIKMRAVEEGTTILAMLQALLEQEYATAPVSTSETARGKAKMMTKA